MVDIRYHIATLVGLFLALAVGILIGSTLVGSDVLVQQQKKMIARLEEQFSGLREQQEVIQNENQFLKSMNQHYEEYSQTVSPSIIKNRLVGWQGALVV
ncbi:MAG: copper transporter, partial [Chitinophagales bacterium]